MNKIYKYTVDDKIVTEFVIDIVTEAMKRFDTTYDKIVAILKQLKYWDLFIDTDVTIIGAHEGIEPVLEEIGEALQ